MTNNEPTRPARSATRRIALTFLGVLVALAASGYAVYAAGGPDFRLSASPASQTIGSGQSTNYAVSLARSGGLTSTVQLSVSGLPAHATASFSQGSLTGSQTTSTLSVATAGTTPAGTYTLTITGKAGSLTHTATATLVVVAPGFTLSATPASQTIDQGDSGTYTVTLNRIGGFSGAVALSVSGLPDASTVTWSPSSTIPAGASTTTFTVHTSATTHANTYPMNVSGTGQLVLGSATRSTSVSLQVKAAQAHSFAIAGNLTQKLYPGTKAPLNLTLTNPENNQDLRVTKLTVTVGNTTSNAGCSGATNFSVDQFSGSYPLTIHPGTTSLSSLVADSSKWPQVRMLDLPTSQDACQNATLTLSYSGTATS